MASPPQECVLCFSTDATITFVPCFHTVYCTECWEAAMNNHSTCGACRSEITYYHDSTTGMLNPYEYNPVQEEQYMCRICVTAIEPSITAAGITTAFCGCYVHENCLEHSDADDLCVRCDSALLPPLAHNDDASESDDDVESESDDDVESESDNVEPDNASHNQIEIIEISDDDDYDIIEISDDDIIEISDDDHAQIDIIEISDDDDDNKMDIVDFDLDDEDESCAICTFPVNARSACSANCGCSAHDVCLNNHTLEISLRCVFCSDFIYPN